MTRLAFQEVSAFPSGQHNGDGTSHSLFRARWVKWSEIVHLFATRSQKRHELDPDAYQALHATLCRMVREDQSETESSAANPKGSPEPSPLWKLLAPWGTLHALQHADPVHVQHLDDQCGEVLRLLGGSRESRCVWYLKRCLSVGLVLAGLLGLYAVMAERRVASWSSIGRVSRDWLASGKQFVSSSGLEGSFLVLCGTITLVAILVVCRSTNRR